MGHLLGTRRDLAMDRVEKFKSWLEKRGAIVVPPTNEWEVVRFKTINGTSVVYTNKHGDLTFTGESAAAHKAWQNGDVASGGQ